MDFKIESGFEIPSTRYRLGIAEALRKLARSDVGNSLFIDRPESRKPSTHVAQCGRAAIMAVGKGWYTVRAVEGGARVWKIAEPTARAQAA